MGSVAATSFLQVECAVARHDRVWPWLRLLLTGLVLSRGLVVLCVMPPFEAWDEYQHLGYITYLTDTERRPILGQSDVPISLLTQLPAFPHSQSALRQIGTLGAVDYTTYWSRFGRGKVPRSSPLEPARVPLYQAQHGPFYYRLAAPVFNALGGVGDLRTSIGGLRLVNLLLTVGSVWIALLIVDRLVRDRALAALCGLLIATQPLFLINGARVANDAPGVFLATVAVGWAFNLSRRHLVASTFGLGVLVGLAVLAKTVNLGLLPFVAACWLTALVRDRHADGGRAWLTMAFNSALALIIGFLVVTQAEFQANLNRYGSLTVMQEAVENRQAGRGPADLFLTARSIAWPHWTRNLWLRDSVMSGGWSWAGKLERSRSRHEVLAVFGLLGWGWIILPTCRRRIFDRFRDPACPWLCLVLCVGYSGALGYHVVQSQLRWGSISTNPWYAAAAYPWFLLLVSGGAFAWPLGRLRCLLPGAIALVFLEAESSSVLGSMTALYAALADWSEALRRLAFLQPRMFGTTTLYASMAGALFCAGTSILVVVRRAIEPTDSRDVPGRPHILMSRDLAHDCVFDPRPHPGVDADAHETSG